MHNIPPRFVIPGSPMLAHVIMIFRVRLHRYLRVTTCAFEVKTVNLDSQVLLIVAGLLPHVELRPNVKEVTTGVATDTHREHHTHVVLFFFGSSDFGQFGGIEIWRIIFV